MVIPRTLMWAGLVVGLVFGVIFLLIDYYRPILEFSEIESGAWLAFAIVLPVAIAAVLAYSPALRRCCSRS